MNEIGLDQVLIICVLLKLLKKFIKLAVKSYHSYHIVVDYQPQKIDNPLGYKFSWSSRGVLLALRNQAKYWLDGKSH